MTIFGRDKQDLGALPADVAELLARGSGHVEHLDPEVRARLRARLLAPGASGAGPSGAGPHGAAASSASAGAARAFLAKPIALVLTTFALGMGSGAVLHGWLRSSVVPTAAPSTPPAPPPAPVSIAPPPAPQSAAAPGASSACPVPRAPDRDRDHERDDDRGLGRERALLEQARDALVGGDLHLALAALDRHRHAFPDGRLAEERDVLRARTLLAAGRVKEARAEGERFLRKHPASLFRPAIEQTIAKTDFRSAPNEVTGGHE